MNSKIIGLILTTILFLNLASKAQVSSNSQENIIWKKDVYRLVELNQGENALLFYPQTPTDKNMNLFSNIFKSISQGDTQAYEYLDGREVFEESNALKFEDMLDRFEIPFTKRRSSKTKKNIFKINDIDVPTSEVTLYYIKECYYIDKNTSTLNRKAIAICPVLIRTDEMGEIRKHPLFWVKIDQIKDVLMNQRIPSNKFNSAKTQTYYDFFNNKMYTGEIYKISNLKNQTIWDYCKTPEKIKKEQQRIEIELKKLANEF